MNEPETASNLTKADSPRISLDSSEPVLKGIALWQLGHSMREAARMAGCAPSSISMRMKSLGLNADERKPDREATLKRLAALQEETARQLGEALREGKIKEGQLPVTLGILSIPKTRF